MQLTAEKIVERITEKQYAILRDELNEENPIDIAALLSEIPENSLPVAFRLLAKELAAETFVEMDSESQELLIRSFSDNELRSVTEELFSDDMVDIIEEMPASLVKRILATATSETRASVNTLLRYSPDSAGGIMTLEYVRLLPTMTVSQAFERIKRTGVDKETIYTCYVTDTQKRLLGVVTVKDMLLAEPDLLILDIMETNVIFTYTDEDKESAAKIFVDYGFLALPVVDKENRLVGIVTYDDAIDIISEESEEDMQIMAAITPSDTPYLKTSVFSIWKARIPWLLLLMISSTFTGLIITSFEDALAASVALTAFIPMLMGTGGNSGSQSSVTVIRSLSLDELEFKDLFRVVWKEVRVSFFCAIALAIANFVKMILIDMLLIKGNAISLNREGLLVALVVCLALAVTVICAKIIGAVLPILAKKLGFDPAVMVNPFITTIVDALSLLVYFFFAKTIILS
ncbi:MAG: magnesium transporter [Clostridia bacterium]|nr:magnesium transporter [Clostridia bacterium]